MNTVRYIDHLLLRPQDLSWCDPGCSSPCRGGVPRDGAGRHGARRCPRSPTCSSSASSIRTRKNSASCNRMQNSTLNPSYEMVHRVKCITPTAVMVQEWWREVLRILNWTFSDTNIEWSTLNKISKAFNIFAANKMHEISICACVRVDFRTWHCDF